MRRPVRRPWCLPWEPTTDPRAFTFENMEKRRSAFVAGREAVVADALAADPDTSDATVKLIVFAWPYLTTAERARVITLVITDEVRAAFAAAQARQK